MALTIDKIGKLRELAERGVDGEKLNARDILEKNGIDWRKPKEKIVDSVKKSFGGNVTRKFSLPIEHSSDTLFLAVVLNLFKIAKPSFQVVNSSMAFVCTEGESKQIGRFFYDNREKFNSQMVQYAYTKVEL